MLAFTNTKFTKSEAVALAKLHREQDAFIKGTYGELTSTGWRGCSVGCMAQGKHGDYPALFGIDARIASLSDGFFESLSNYKDWTVTLFESVKEGYDTTIAYYKFMHWLLVDPEFGVSRFNSHKSITDVADLFLTAANGGEVSDKEWRDAAGAAGYAAAAYADAAAYTQHYEVMAKKLCYFLEGN